MPSAATRMLRRSSSSGPGAAYRAAVLADAPVGYWRLDETSGSVAADSSGNSLAGVYTGAVALAAATGANGRPVPAWSGASGYVEVPSSSPLNVTGDITVESWVNVANFSTYRALVTKATTGGLAAPYDQYFNLTDGRAVTAIGAQGTGVGVAPSTGVDLHLVQVRFGRAYEQWVNGVLVSSNAVSYTSTGAAGTGANPLRIGRRNDGATQMQGAIYEVAIYASRLAGTRIAAHYAARGA